ncbi:MAG: lactate utilization protein C [Marmoricola sp.]|nr:lactate utilization protein C [Marmoricola sp.]
MSARDEVLARVREALRDASLVPHEAPLGADQRHPGALRDASLVPHEAPQGPDERSPASLEGAALLDLFVERVEDYRAVVERCTVAELAERVAAAIDGRSVVVPDGLDLDVPGAVADTGLSAAALDEVDAVVTRSVVGIAETGTIVLDHSPDQGRRAITLVPDRHVCVVRASDVVADVPDAVRRLGPTVADGRPLTWISGPSATSDIELSRVEGVHGPRHLHVIVVDD